MNYHSIEKTTRSSQKAAESELGVGCSSLLHLLLYDPIRSIAIDVMHNHFLGTGKHVFNLFISDNLISKEELVEIDNNSEPFIVPNNIGRLPTHISSNQGSFTAAPSDHYQGWLLYICAHMQYSLKSYFKHF